jgi:predicted Zn-dependent protease with MMP-like domain
MEVDDEEFEGLVSEALDTIPPELARLIDNVVVLVEDEPPAGAGDLLGMYDGISLTRRDTNYTFSPPDRILVFKGPLLRMCRTPEQLAHEVRITIVHEVAHYFGIEEDQLHAWGYG